MYRLHVIHISVQTATELSRGLG
uniref:Uncharacterized protein n=1 Tax=Anguilla anguilla TaxID=7936 RepID=A0A0E9RCU2_ANGAN